MTFQQLKPEKRVHLPATAVVIGLMLLLTVLVHAIGGPAVGLRWSPLFYVPLVAAMLFHLGVALIACLVLSFELFLEMAQQVHWPWKSAV